MTGRGGRSWKRVCATVVAVVATLALTGCGDTLLGPASGPGTPAPPSGPEVLFVRADGTFGFMPASVAALRSDVLTTTDRSLMVSQKVDGAVGGMLRCGRFLLHVPAGAFDGTGTVSMLMRDSTVMVVDLEVSPAELNGFQVPVTLAVNTTGTDVSSDTLSIYWYDPEKADWTGLACDSDLSTDATLLETITETTLSPLEGTDTTTKGLMTPLVHFSRYSAGKAGW
ncbi:MAG TPA: hypothetical protein VF363_03700 [Candidatus Eisenbacteria bacterium]